MYEMIGKVVVFAVIAVVLPVFITALIRALLVLWIRIYAHCFLSIGVKEEYKQNSFYKFRIFLKIFRDIKYVLEEGFWGDCELIYNSHIIDFKNFIPKVIKKC